MTIVKKDIPRLRKEILSKVADFYRSNRECAEFIPGKTPIRYAGRVYNEREICNLVESSLDFWLTAGRFAKLFEENLSRFLGIKYCMLTNSGSSANLLALSALTSPLLGNKRLRPGDEVITTACGFPTTLNPILQNNLTPVFVDVGLETYNIAAERIERAITKKTKAIFIAHTLGNPFDIVRIRKIVKKYGLWFVEDNCDALGSKFKGRYTGTFGHLSTCSFYPAHHITTGEGGAVLTADPLLRKIILSLRDWGRDCRCDPGQDNACGKRFSHIFKGLPFGYDHKYVYSHIGYNLKITEMQAAVGCAQLEKLPQFIRDRQKNFSSLYGSLKKYTQFFILPRWLKEARPSWFGFPILIKENAPFKRADLVDFLEKNKIATRMLFGGNLIQQPAYLNMRYRLAGALKNTDLIMNNLFWLGVYPGIGKKEIRFIVKTITEFIKESIQ